MISLRLFTLVFSLFISFSCHAFNYQSDNVEAAYECIQTSLAGYEDQESAWQAFQDRIETARNRLSDSIPIAAESDTIENTILAYARLRGINGELARKSGYSEGQVIAILQDGKPQVILKVYPHTVDPCSRK